jgi:putative FmdB family regulatory protein
MPVYEYKCHGCEKEVDISQSIKEKPKKKCPLCNQLKLERLISTTTCFVRGDPTTIGQLSERNIKSIGKDFIQEKNAKYKETMKINEESTKRNQINQKINKMSSEQKRKYIENG